MKKSAYRKLNPQKQWLKSSSAAGLISKKSETNVNDFFTFLIIRRIGLVKMIERILFFFEAYYSRQRKTEINGSVFVKALLKKMVAEEK